VSSKKQCGKNLPLIFSQKTKVTAIAAEYGAKLVIEVTREFVTEE
jgi:hypothetical protein